jgi:uncharacterized protein (TIGR04222 family)
MLEILRSIPGPQFLFIFPILVMIGIFVGRFLINGGQAGMRMPAPSALSPTAVACLRGGWELVLKTTIFSLQQRGIIEISGTAGAQVLKRAEGASKPAERIEAAIWDFLKTEQKPEYFFKNTMLKSLVDLSVQQLQQDLERKGLMKPAGRSGRDLLIFLAVLVSVEGIGAAKFAFGIIHQKPSGVLAAMMFIALIAISIALKPTSRITPLGTAYLKRMEEHFEWLKDAVKGKESRGIDPAYAFAIFGTTVLAGTLLYSSFSDAFPGSPSGGCGGSSNSSDGDSGSGCSGGGCGGCGGGGGD